MVFHYVIGGAIVAALLVVLANYRQKHSHSADHSVSIDNDEFDGTVGDPGETNDTRSDANLPKLAPLALTDDNWEHLLVKTKSDLPLVIEFHTDWCPGCRAQAPIMQRAAAKYVARARFFTADCDDFDHLARVGNVQKIPSTFFVDTASKTQIVHVGLVQLDQFGEILQELAAKVAASKQSTSASDKEHPYLLG